jgi:hypothetical protein
MLVADRPNSPILIRKLCYLSDDPNHNLFLGKKFLDVNPTSRRRRSDAKLTSERRQHDAPEESRGEESRGEKKREDRRARSAPNKRVRKRGSGLPKDWQLSEKNIADGKRHGLQRKHAARSVAIQKPLAFQSWQGRREIGIFLILQPAKTSAQVRPRPLSQPLATRHRSHHAAHEFPCRFPLTIDCAQPSCH